MTTVQKFALPKSVVVSYNDFDGEGWKYVARDSAYFRRIKHSAGHTSSLDLVMQNQDGSDAQAWRIYSVNDDDALPADVTLLHLPQYRVIDGLAMLDMSTSKAADFRLTMSVDCWQLPEIRAVDSTDTMMVTV